MDRAFILDRGMHCGKCALQILDLEENPDGTSFLAAVGRDGWGWEKRVKSGNFCSLD